MITFHDHYARIYTKTTVALMVAFTWIFSFAILLPTLVGKFGKSIEQMIVNHFHFMRSSSSVKVAAMTGLDSITIGWIECLAAAGDQHVKFQSLGSTSSKQLSIGRHDSTKKRRHRLARLSNNSSSAFLNYWHSRQNEFRIMNSYLAQSNGGLQRKRCITRTGLSIAFLPLFNQYLFHV